VETALRELLVDGASRMGIGLDAEAVERFATLLSLLQLWGKKINLTTRIEGREMVIHHFLDSLAGVPFLTEDPGARVIDLGAGAGFPSFPLKFALPRLRITMVESVRKKVAFCREVIRATGCADIEAVCARAEDLGRREERRDAYDWAVGRALASSAEVMRLALPFVRPGGRVLLYKGTPDRRELEDLGVACARIGATWRLHEVDVPHLEARRSLIVLGLAES
jgi:16S rRNA (guanine527-N7)-methyltransferase